MVLHKYCKNCLVSFLIGQFFSRILTGVIIITVIRTRRTKNSSKQVIKIGGGGRYMYSISISFYTYELGIAISYWSKRGINYTSRS